MRTFFGFILCALALDFLFRLPRRPTPDRVAWDKTRFWTHNVANYWPEAIRADIEWWAKCLAHVSVWLVCLVIFT